MILLICCIKNNHLGFASSEDTGQSNQSLLSTLCVAKGLGFLHQNNMSVCFIPLYTQLLYSKTGVIRGIHYFLIFALKHILWVLVRTV